MCTPITLRLVGVRSRNFTTRRAVRQGCSCGHNFWGRPAPWNFGGQKTSKIRRDFRKLSTSIANISGTDPLVENRKSNWSTTTPPTLDEKRWWTLVHKQKSYRRACRPTQIAFFYRIYFGSYRGCWPLKFLHALEIDQGILAHPRGRPHVGLCPIFLVVYIIVLSFMSINYSLLSIRLFIRCTSMIVRRYNPSLSTSEWI